MLSHVKKIAMAFTSNIQAYKSIPTQHALTVSYGLLVAVELALKDGNCAIPGTGHDVPGMLGVASNLPTATPYVSAQLISHAQQLQASLGVITCQKKNGAPGPVPANNYPYLRYCRMTGDWAGISETLAADLDNLEVVCQNLCAFLSAHGGTLGVSL